MFKWFKRLSVTARRAVVLALVLVAIAGVASAAWLITRQVEGTASVLGTFALNGLDCDDVIANEWGICTTPLTNQYNLPLLITNVVMTTGRTDIEIDSANWMVDGVLPPGGGFPVDPGVTVGVEVMFRPVPDAVLGEVAFVMEVTARAD